MEAVAMFSMKIDIFEAGNSSSNLTEVYFLIGSNDLNPLNAYNVKVTE